MLTALQRVHPLTDTTRMSSTLGEQLGAPTRRIAIAGAVIVVLVGAAIGVTLWRFGASTAKYEATLKNTATIAKTTEARTAVYDVLNAARALTTSSGATRIDALRDAGTELKAALASLTLSTAGTPAEQTALSRARANAAALGTAVAALAQNAGTPAAAAEV